MVDVPGSDWAMHRDMHSWHSWHSWCTTSVGLRGIICNMFALWGLELKMYTQTNIRDSKSMTRNWREMACCRTCYGQYYNIFPFFRCLCIICIIFICCICLAWFLEFFWRLRVRSDGQVRLVDAPELADHIDPPLDVHPSMWLRGDQISPPLFFVWIL